jgi:hypothetical protein
VGELPTRRVLRVADGAYPREADYPSGRQRRDTAGVLHVERLRLEVVNPTDNNVDAHADE